MWNPVLFAVAFQHLKVVRFFVEEMKINAKLCLRDPVHSGEHSEVSPFYEVRSKCFAVLVAIQNHDQKMLNYLLDNLYQFWSSYELEVILAESHTLISNEFMPTTVDTILNSKTYETIFLNRCFKHQIEMIQKLIKGDYFDVEEDKLKQIIVIKLTELKFLNAYLATLLKLKSHDTEKMLSLFKRIPEQLIQHEEDHYRKILDSIELTKIKNEQVKKDYEKIMKQITIILDKEVDSTFNDIHVQILTMVKDGQIANLQQIIEKNNFTQINQITDRYSDVSHEPEDLLKMMQVAKIVLNKYETGGQMTRQSQDNNEEQDYIYIREWNPLLLAIYYGHFHIVKYFCEVMKVHLRTTLAMSKGGDYSLLFALACGLIKEQNMEIFKYLWDKFDFIWDYKCLKQALLMIIIHKQRDLLKFILQSDTTQSLFLSFSYHFRIQFISEFVNNYFDFSEIEEELKGNENELKIFQDIAEVFKDEICKRPYSPISLLVFLFIHHDSNRFLKCYDLIMDQDIERFIRSNFVTANNVVEAFRCQSNIQKLREEVPDFDKIKIQLNSFAYRISNTNLFSRMKAQEELIQKKEEIPKIEDIQLKDDSETQNDEDENLKDSLYSKFN